MKPRMPPISRPAISAAAIPIRIVTPIPIGSAPGWTSRPSRPTTRPTTTSAMMRPITGPTCPAAGASNVPPPGPGALDEPAGYAHEGAEEDQAEEDSGHPHDLPRRPRVKRPLAPAGPEQRAMLYEAPVQVE